MKMYPKLHRKKTWRCWLRAIIRTNDGATTSFAASATRSRHRCWQGTMAFDVYQHSRKVTELLESRIPFVVVTMVDRRGSAPQIEGAKAIVTSRGIVEGTIGGGKVEARAIQRAQELLGANDGRSCEFVVWNLQTDIGMTCGGEVKFFFEVCLCNDWSISLFGAGHIARCSHHCCCR